MEVSSPHDNQFLMLRWAEEEEERVGFHLISASLGAAPTVEVECGRGGQEAATRAFR